MTRNEAMKLIHEIVYGPTGISATDQYASRWVSVLEALGLLKFDALEPPATDPVPPVSTGLCTTIFQEGMTLRDWFAGQVLVSLREFDPDTRARHAYRIADAMLRERV